MITDVKAVGVQRDEERDKWAELDREPTSNKLIEAIESLGSRDYANESTLMFGREDLAVVEMLNTSFQGNSTAKVGQALLRAMASIEIPEHSHRMFTPLEFLQMICRTIEPKIVPVEKGTPPLDRAGGL